MNSSSLQLYLNLSVQRALFGNVTKNVKYVIAEFLNDRGCIVFYFDADIGIDDLDAISIIDSEVRADFDNDFIVEMITKRIAGSEVIDNLNDLLVYRRVD